MIIFKYFNILAFSLFVFISADLAADGNKPNIPAQAQNNGFIAGQVQVSGEPTPGWTVDLYQAGSSGSELLDSSSSNGNGKFHLDSNSGHPGSTLYIIASKGQQNKMIALIGQVKNRPENIVINELMTVAS